MPSRLSFLSRAGCLGVCAVLAGAVPARLAGSAGPLRMNRLLVGVEPLGGLGGTRATGRPRGLRAWGDSLAPVPLSEALLERLKTFATHWEHQPARVRDTLVAQPAYQQRFTLVVTDVKGLRYPANFAEQVDMVRLAAAAPEVAAALQAVQLSARQWEQAMRSLYLAVLTNDVDLANQRHEAPATPTHRSVTWQNVEFLRAHPDVFDDLRAAALWVPRVRPKEVPMASDTVNQHLY